jgi:hypothetical protein
MLIENISMSIMMNYFVLRTGSVWPGIMFHGLSNELPYGLAIAFADDAFTSQQSMTFSVIVTVINVVAAVILLMIVGPRLGWSGATDETGLAE